MYFLSSTRAFKGERSRGRVLVDSLRTGRCRRKASSVCERAGGGSVKVVPVCDPAIACMHDMSPTPVQRTERWTEPERRA
jgi:hypothetical protein